MGRIVRLILVATAVLAFSPALFAQNAVVLGTVLDADGKPMQAVSVLLENKARAFVRVAVTGADGSYTISGVEPAGGYMITATSADGTEIDHTVQPFAVSVGDEREILPALRAKRVGVAGTEPAAGETPAASATPRKASAVPNDKNTNIGGVISGAQLRTLPLYNRNFLVLGLLSPNTHDVEAGSPLSGASFSIAGQRASSNNFLLDGAENIASSSNQAIPFQVNDAIQEFRVTSSTANAEFGRGAGGVVSVISQSGTNKWHGSMFGYFANDALNMDSPLSVYNGSGFDKAAAYAGSLTAPAIPPVAGQAVAPQSYNQYVATAKLNGYCTNSIVGILANPATCAGTAQGKNDLFNPAAILAANDSKKSPFDSKQFGANIGGPLSINKKIFIFGSYEGTRIDNPNAIFERVPTAFDKSIVSTNVAHANDYLLAKNILGLFPASNVVGVPGVLEFYKGTAPNYTNVHNALIRSDYKKSDSMNFSFRYAGQLLNQLHDDTLPVSSTYPGNGAIRKAQNQNGVFTFTKSYKKIINEARLGLTQFRVTDSAQDASFNAKNIGLNGTALQTILLSGLDTQYSGASLGKAGAFGGWYDSFWSSIPDPLNPGNPLQVATARMLPTLDGLFPFARMGAPLDAPSLHRDTTWFGSDALSWSHGKHSFKFGGDFRFIQNRVTDGGFSRGYIASGNIGEFTSDSETCNTGTVSNGAAALPCTGLNPAFRAPSFDYALNQQPNFNGLFNSFSYAGFAQDQWKLGKRLTINMGVRYEFFGVPHEVNDQIWNFDPVANGLVQQNGTKVFDPYGYACLGAVTGTSTVVDSVPRDRSSPGSWQCLGTSAAGNIIQPDLNDFAGRFGMAWDVRGDGRTIIRGGAGIFYDQSPISYTARLMENRPTQLNTANPRYIYGQTFASTFCIQCGFGNSTLNPNFAGYDPLRQSAASPFSLAARDNRNSKTPYTRQVNVTLQQSLGDYTAIELGYIGAGGHRIPIITNTGYNNEWFCNVSKIPVVNPGPPKVITGASNSVCDPFSSFPVGTQANIGSSIYHSALARVRVAQFHGLRVNATYTYSQSMDNASSANPNLVPTPLLTQAFGLQKFGLANPFSFIFTGGFAAVGPGKQNITIPAGLNIPASVSGADTFTSSLTTTGAGRIFVSRYNVPQDPNNFAINDWGPSDFDTTHRVVVDYNYELPILRNSEKWGGWQVSGIVTVQSGQPFTIFSGPVFGESAQRVNATNVQLTGDPNNYFSSGTTFTLPGQAVVPGTANTRCLYAAAAPSTVLLTGPVGSACTGNTGRNQFTGPAYASMDFAIQKGFKLFGSESKELTLRTEAFNLLNRANYYNPISTFSLDGISTNTATGTTANVNPDFGKVKSAHAPLQLQFSARFTF